MRKINISGMLDRHTSNHVHRMDSQIQGINQILLETTMTNGGLYDQPVESLSNKKQKIDQV